MNLFVELLKSHVSSAQFYVLSAITDDNAYSLDIFKIICHVVP